MPVYDRKGRVFASVAHRINYYRKVNRNRGRGRGGRRTAYKRRRIADFQGDVIMGMGAYKRAGRVLDKHQLPQVKNTKTGFIVHHKEFLTDVPSTTSAAFLNLTLNPANPLTFPWLSNIAINFEEWVPRGIAFMFKSTSSDAVVSTAANAALGTVVIATDYNVANPSFANKQQMELYEGAVSCKPSCDLTHFVECKKKQTIIDPLYVRPGQAALPSNADARLYDLGVTTLGVFNQQSQGPNVGELWISYEIEFRKPRILPGEPAASEDGTMDHFAAYSTNGYSIASPYNIVTGTTPARPFGTSTSSVLLPSPSSNLGGRLSGGIVAANTVGNYPVPTGTGTSTLVKTNIAGFFGLATAQNTYYFPPGISGGYYMVLYIAVYGTQGSAASDAFVLTNCSALNVVEGGTASSLVNTSSANTTTDMTIQYLQITAANASFSMTGSAGMTNPTGWDLYVIEIPINN